MSLGGGMRATFCSLRNRNYRLYALGMGISAIGTWMQRVAQAWLILELTGGSGSTLGIVTAMQFIPPLLFGLWGGVIADRYAKRRVLLVTQTAMGVLALVLGTLVVTGSVRIWHVYALAFALGLCTMVDNPTRQSFIVELVEPADRANAIALDSAMMTLARIIGPAIAGVLINIVGSGPVFLINAFSFVAVILGLRFMRDAQLHMAPRIPRGTGSLRAGLAYVRGRGDLMLVLLLVGFISAFGMNPQVTTVLMTRNAFHEGAGSFGLASMVFAVGAFVGALLAARSRRPGRRTVLVAALLFGVLEAGSSLLPTYAWFVAALAPTGLMLVILNNATTVMMQLDVAAEMRGRVNGLFFLLFNGTTPIGAPVIGWLAQELGARAGLLAAGAVTILVTATVAPLMTGRRYPDAARIPDPVPAVGGERR